MRFSTEVSGIASDRLQDYPSGTASGLQYPQKRKQAISVSGIRHQTVGKGRTGTGRETEETSQTL
ncbi:MAG: hypothetical protein UW39_C0022G0028, partial [Parcubacteria group bacterium GW2011_GWC2_44_17]